jgi:hypothetical protein
MLEVHQRTVFVLSVLLDHTLWLVLDHAPSALLVTQLLLTVFPKMPVTRSRLSVWLSTVMLVPLLLMELVHFAQLVPMLLLATSHALTALRASGHQSTVFPRTLAIL